MKQGKLSNLQLNELILSKLTPHNDETLLGAGVGEDCCAVDLGDICVVSTDPITAATANVGSLAIHINANDIASAGAVPVAALVTILIPVDAKKSQLDDMMQQLTQTASALHIDIIGGHTEVTESVNRIVVSVTMIGKPAVKGKVFRTCDMRVGDDIVMTKYAGMEGTAIIAEDIATDVKGLLDAEDIRQTEYIKQSLSVVQEGIAAAKFDGVSAMHDITEGGVKGAIGEMCEAAGVGAEVDFGLLPVLEITSKLCEQYGLDVTGLISSGSMLIAVQDGTALVEHLAELGIPAKVVGRVTKDRLIDTSTGKRFDMPERDELYKALEQKRAK